MYKAGGILLTIFSIDDQTPWVGGPWNYPSKTIDVMIIGSNGAVYQANATQPAGQTNTTFTYVGLLTDSYSVFVQTLGYTQSEIIHLNVELGGNSDAAVWMIENPVIDLDLAFRHEAILSNITSTLPFAQPINHIDATPVRFEVFDQFGNFVAANATYVPNNATTCHFTLAGFDQYFGDPRFVWSGFYDTTDGASQSPGGLVLYPWSDLPREYTIRIWVEGYYQENQLQVLVPTRERGNVSVVELLDRATRIAGNIAGPDFFEFARPLSWATITLEPNDYTLTSIIDVTPGNYTTYSLDGSFQLWVPEGSYGMGVSLARILLVHGSNSSCLRLRHEYADLARQLPAIASNKCTLVPRRYSDGTGSRKYKASRRQTMFYNLNWTLFRMKIMSFVVHFPGTAPSI